MKFGVGQPVRRFEDVTFLTGAGRYTDDIALPGMLVAHVLRSQAAHGRLLRVDTATASAMPGVRLVLTGQDVVAEGIGNVPCLYPLTNRDGTSRADTPRPLLAIDRVRHVGEPVALIVADTLAQAKDAAEAVEVEIEALPVTVGVEAAMEPGAPRLFEDVDGNVVFDWDNDACDIPATDQAFARAARVVGIKLVNNRLVANPMEARNALADFHPEDGRSTLYTASQGPHHVRNPIADIVLKLPRDVLRVITTNVGGAFGMKAFVYPEQALVVWASRRLRRAVKWQEDRSEAFVADNHGRDHVTEAELALDEAGRMLGLRVRVLANLGAYLSPMGAYVPTRSSDLYPGLYAIGAAHINVKGICTNTTPVCAYRGAGRPEASYLIERLVDKAAREMGIGVDEIRRRNLIPPHTLPFTNATKLVFDSGEFEQAMQQCMEQADWAGFPARRAEATGRGQLRGIGLAVYTERCGGGAPETAEIVFTEDGRIELVMGNVEYGTGIGTAYKQLIADKLGIAPDLVTLVTGDTARTPLGLTGGSRSLAVGGAAILAASSELIIKGRELAGEVMEVAEADLQFADAAFHIVGTDRRMTLFDLARAAREAGRGGALDCSHKRVPEAPTYPNGCHIVELEIDPQTGGVSIERYTVVDDFGVTINPLMLEGQVQGGIVQGVGQALHENVVYDEDTGQPLTGSFQDYRMPRAGDFPQLSITLRNVPCTTNPLGVKGAGEAGAVGAPSAVMNAVVDALYPAHGIVDIDMPATTHKLWSVLRSE